MPKEKGSIYDQYIVEATPSPSDKKVIYKSNFWSEFWKLVLAFLIALLLFLLLYWLFLRFFWDKESKNNKPKEKTTQEKIMSETAPWKCQKNTDYVFISPKNKELQGALEKFGNQNNANDEEFRQNFKTLHNQYQDFIDQNKDEPWFQNDENFKQIRQQWDEIFGRNETILSSDKALGIEVADGSMSVIIPANMTFPVTKSNLYSPHEEYQDWFTFKIYHGNDKIAKNNTLLWTYYIGGFKPLKEKQVRLKITFDVDKNGKLKFIAKDILNPENKLEGYLDTELDILSRGGKNNTEIKQDISHFRQSFEDYFNNKTSKKSEFNTWDIVSVTDVIDWDTFRFSLDGKIATARMIGIDAPENSTLRKGYTEAYWEESKQFLQSKIAGKKVYIEFDSSQAEIDKYGRYLVYVFLGDENINNTMIEKGFAKEYTYNTPYKYQSQFIDSQNQAKNMKSGIWK